MMARERPGYVDFVDLRSAQTVHGAKSFAGYVELNSGASIGSHLTVADSANVILGTSTGTKIGTASSQKMAFYGATPVDRPDTVADPSGGATQDAECRTAVGLVIDRLQELGLIA